MIFFKLYYDYALLSVINFKFNNQRIDFFNILKKIDNFVYKFDILLY